MVDTIDSSVTVSKVDAAEAAEDALMEAEDQAAADVDSGMVDTDLRNKPGVQQVQTPAPREATAKPLPDTKQD